MPNRRSITVLVDPTFSDAEKAINNAFLQRKTLLVVGNCSIDYSGRASSSLTLGDRIVIAKADGSFLIHRSFGYEPVNWMPKGNVVFNVQHREHVLEIRAIRRKPPESIKVSFADIRLVTALDLADSAEFSLNASEQDMQKAILLRPELLEEGIKPISWEKKVEPGFIDVYAIDKQGKLVVIEIKRKTAGKDAVLQLSRYIEAIRRKADREVRGIIASPGIGKDVQRLLAISGLEFKHLDPKKCAETLRRTEMRKLSEYLGENPS